MKIINKHIIKLSKNLKKIQKYSYNILEDYLKEKVQEAKIDGNKKHFTYLSNLILIKHKQQIYCRIKYHINQSKSSGIKYLEVPIDTYIHWNSIPSSLPEDQWEN